MLSSDFIDAFEKLNADIQMLVDQQAGVLYRAMWRGEKDLKVLERLADHLMDNSPEAGEEDYRNFVEYVRGFNPEKAQEYEDYLEHTLGYKNHVIYAAAKLARELHRGQTDKGGNDYFKSHLLNVAKGCCGKYDMVVGFLHDAAEDCDITEHDVIERLKSIMDDWEAHPEHYGNLVDEFEDELMNFPNEVYHPLRDEEWDKIENALMALNHNRYSTREEYIENIKKDDIAIRVKLCDLKNNMDLSRIPNPTEKDFERKKRYEREYEELVDAYRLVNLGTGT